LKKDGEMADTPPKSYINTTITSALLTSLKVLAAQQGKRLNILLEEAIQDLLKKYDKKLEK
jgi:hypothetical protein